MSDSRLAIFLCFLFAIGLLIIAAPAKLGAEFAYVWHAIGGR